MACGYAKFTGRLGCCLATSGPGGIHLLNGLYDAKLDGQPVLAITGHALPRPDRHPHPAGRRARQAVHGRRRLQHPRHGRRPTSRTWPSSPAAPRWPTAASPTSHSRSTSRSCRSSEASARERNVPHHTSRRAGAPARRAAGRGRPAARGRDPERRQEGRHPGRPRRARRRRRAGAARRDARRADRQAAARQGVRCPTTAPTPPAASACSARGRRRRRSKSCDTLLIVGSSLPLHRVLSQARPGARRSRSTSTRSASACATRSRSAWSATPARRCSALLPLLAAQRRTARFLEQAQEGMKDWRELMDERGTAHDTPMKPQVVAHELGKRLRDDAIVCYRLAARSPPGAARHIPMRARPDVLAARATWPPWPAACPTPSPRRSPIPDRQVRRLRRRRRLHDADGRARDRA